MLRNSKPKSPNISRKPSGPAAWATSPAASAGSAATASTLALSAASSSTLRHPAATSASAFAVTAMPLRKA